MRLVIATPLYPPEIGGPATYAKLLSLGLPEKGITIELVKFSDVRHLPKVIRHYVYYRRVLKVARSADVVLALDPVSVGLPALRAAQKAKKPFIVKIVGDYAWEQGRQRFGISQTLDEFSQSKQVPFLVRVLRRVQTYVAQNAMRIITPSIYLKDVVVAWGVPREKIEVIYNAVLLEEMGTIPDDVAHLPRPLIVTAGRMVPWKHTDTIIDAVALLREKQSQTSLAIVGEGPEYMRVTKYAKQKLGNGYVFTHALSHSDTLVVMKSADVFVLNSSYEGLSHLLIEALTLEVPIVATRVGGNPEVITDDKDGLLVPVGDTKALVNALTRVLSGDELRTRLSACARESARRFSVETMLRETATVLFHI